MFTNEKLWEYIFQTVNKILKDIDLDENNHLGEIENNVYINRKNADDKLHIVFDVGIDRTPSHPKDQTAKLLTWEEVCEEGRVVAYESWGTGVIEMKTVASAHVLQKRPCDDPVAFVEMEDESVMLRSFYGVNYRCWDKLPTADQMCSAAWKYVWEN